MTPNEAAGFGIHINRDGQRRTAFELLSYPGIDLTVLRRAWPELGGLDRFASEQIEIEAKYAVYLDRQTADIEAVRKDEGIDIPDGIDFSAMAGLSNELKGKLEATRPATLGQAARMEGMTAAALALLLAEIRRHGRKAA